MRFLPLCWSLVALGCAGTAAPTPDWPAAAVVVALPAGTALATDVVPGLPDEPRWRAAAVWWHEALRQTAAFELRGSQPPPADLPVLLLAVDPAARTLAASLAERGSVRALAGASFADDDLPAAIDRLAFAARTALGEPAPAPVPVAAALSPHATVALAVRDARLLLRDGGVAAARRTLLGARRDDGASPALLDALAWLELLRGEAAAAERLCLEALGYRTRLQPTTEHTLARTLLLARASLQPAQAAQRDRELLALGEVACRERPHDLEPLLTLAIAHNFGRAFAVARPLFERLQQAMPDQPVVAYHLGWACLGVGDAPAASRAFDAAALHLPMAWVAVPRAIARFEAGDTTGLGELLVELADEAERGRGPLHEVRRMQAAQALLVGERERARRLLLDDMHWLLQNPSALERGIGAFAEQGAVLVRLGGAAELQPILGALQAQRPGTALADACAFLAGMVEVARTGGRATAIEQRLARGGDSAFASLLAAYAHEVRGEVMDMQAELARAARLSDAPMTKALLARGLRAVGRTAEADTLRATLRSELLAIDLRRTPQHPLLGPELAFAFAAE